jgi:hypothetical protein
MKTLGIITAAIFLSLCGTVMAADSGENHQDDTNATGPNPYMTFSAPIYRGGYHAMALQPPAQHHVVNHHAKR